MKNVLLTWSDRGSEGPIPSYHGKRNSEDKGPILRLLEQAEFRGRYDAAVVLTTRNGERRALVLADELKTMMEKVDIRVTNVEDPSDYYQLFSEHGGLVDALNGRYPDTVWERDVLLSAGTPQSQTMWVILVQAKLLTARMLQVIPSAFVPNPHPKAVREVKLDFEGFPEIRALREEVRRLRAAVRLHAGDIIGESESMRRLLVSVSRVAASDVPVLISGDTGTGKELVARAVHAGSARADGPFVAENCGTFSEGLLASELFGHEQGAFSGAVGRHRGLFEQAHGGTLFLDEVGELGPKEQVHLLRVLQEGVLRRVGGETSVRVNVRIVAATHRPLDTLVNEGKFRSDLYYRLRGASLRLPSLAERPEDIPLLIRHFLAETAPGANLKVSPEAMRAMMQYFWPGNVRELRSEVVRWTVFADAVVRAADLSPEILQADSRIEMQPAQEPDPQRPVLPLSDVIEGAEKAAIVSALLHFDRNLSKTARALKIDRNTLKRKLAAYGMR